MEPTKENPKKEIPISLEDVLKRIVENPSSPMRSPEVFAWLKDVTFIFATRMQFHTLIMAHLESLFNNEKKIPKSHFNYLINQFMALENWEDEHQCKEKEKFMKKFNLDGGCSLLKKPTQDHCLVPDPLVETKTAESVAFTNSSSESSPLGDSVF